MQSGPVISGVARLRNAPVWSSIRPLDDCPECEAVPGTTQVGIWLVPGHESRWGWKKFQEARTRETGLE